MAKNFGENPKENLSTSKIAKESKVSSILSASSDSVVEDDEDLSEECRAEEDRILLDEGTLYIVAIQLVTPWPIRF